MCSGSPIPMKTILRMNASPGRSRAASTTCCTISPALRLRSRPIRAVMQKSQPIAQPTCVEMQSVVCDSPGISTASISCPSSRRKTYLVEPSAERRTAARWNSPMRKCSASFARIGLEIDVISSKLLARC